MGRIKQNELNCCDIAPLILNLIGNSLVHSLYCSRALNLIVDRFQANNNMLIYSYRLL